MGNVIRDALMEAYWRELVVAFVIGCHMPMVIERLREEFLHVLD